MSVRWPHGEGFERTEGEQKCGVLVEIQMRNNAQKSMKG